jgi:hypothetical protein
MKHVAIILNPETMKFDLVLQWPAFSPIGPRLEKDLSMPVVKYSNIDLPEDAVKAAKLIEEWLIKQEAGERDRAASVLPQVDHYNGKEYALESEKPKPPPPKLLPKLPPPKPRQRVAFIPRPFDEETT